jgi:hypothetical protein
LSTSTDRSTLKASTQSKPDLRIGQIPQHGSQRWIGQQLNEPAVGIDHAHRLREQADQSITRQGHLSWQARPNPRASTYPHYTRYNGHKRLEPAVGIDDAKARDVCKPINETPKATDRRKPDLRMGRSRCTGVNDGSGKKSTSRRSGLTTQKLAMCASRSMKRRRPPIVASPTFGWADPATRESTMDRAKSQRAGGRD